MSDFASIAEEKLSSGYVPFGRWLCENRSLSAFDLCPLRPQAGDQRLRRPRREEAQAHRRLVEALSRHLDSGVLEELTLTTNGSQLARYAGEQFRHRVRRINVSL